MKNYLKRTERLRKIQDLDDYSLSNNNVDDEYGLMFGGLSENRITKLINSYPDHTYVDLIETIKKSFGLSNIILGSGSEDLIIRINLILRNLGRIGIFLPNFYRITETAGKYKKIYIPYTPNSVFIGLDKLPNKLNEKVKSIWVANPNPIIGKVFNKQDLTNFIEKNGKILFIIDESAIDFVKNTQSLSLIDLSRRKRNLIVIRSFSKLYGLAGLRAGFATGKAEILQTIKKIGPTFPINSIAEYFIKELLRKRPIIKRIRKKIEFHKLSIEKLLSQNPDIIISKSITNCIFFGHKYKKIFPELLKLGILALDLNKQDGIKEKNFVRLTVHSSESLFNRLFSQLSKFVNKI